MSHEIFTSLQIVVRIKTLICVCHVARVYFILCNKFNPAELNVSNSEEYKYLKSKTHYLKKY